MHPGNRECQHSHTERRQTIFFLQDKQHWNGVADPCTPESGFQKQLHLYAMLHYHMTLGIIAEGHLEHSGCLQTLNLCVLCSAVASR